MIPPELHAQIRRLFFAEHWRFNTIAAQLGVHHDTVRRAVESERFIRPGTQVRPRALDPYKAFITATLEQYPRLRAKLDVLRCPRCGGGCASSPSWRTRRSLLMTFSSDCRFGR